MALRPAVGFHQDEQAHWVVELDCGHQQHVRHRPPFEERPWVVSETGRRRKLGESFDCPFCDMPEIPPDALAYKRTATFDENTVPGGLLKEHDTKEGVWARIVVESGKLAYTIIEPDRRQWVLSPAASGVAAPTAAHFVKPIGEVRFHVEFFRREADPT